MTDSNERISVLERSIADLETKLSAANTMIDQVEKFVVRLDVEHRVTMEGFKRGQQTLVDLMRKQKAWADAESALQQNTRNELMKLTEVYYHVFPERLAQDVKVGKQLDGARPQAEGNGPKEIRG
jgi:hypothetical protein